MGGFGFGFGFESGFGPLLVSHNSIKLPVGFESGFGFEVTGSGFGFGFKKIEVDSDWSGFGFKVFGFGSGFGFEMSEFAHHCTVRISRTPPTHPQILTTSTIKSVHFKNNAYIVSTRFI